MHPEPELQHLIGYDVSELFPKGAGNPVLPGLLTERARAR